MSRNCSGVALETLFEHGIELVFLLVDEAAGIGQENGFGFGSLFLFYHRGLADRGEFDLLPLLILGNCFI